MQAFFNTKNTVLANSPLRIVHINLQKSNNMSSTITTTKPKIIIIGAGPAGLGAATRLLENGINDLIILEAENRIGGRVHSVDFGGSMIDLGGQWCHGEKNNIVYEKVKDLDVLSPSFNTYQDNTYYLSNGTVLNKSITEQLYRIAGEIYDDEENAKAFKGSFGDFFTKEYKEKVAKHFPNDKSIQIISEQMLEWFHKFYLGLNAMQSWNEVSAFGSFKYEECEGNQQLNWRDKGYRTILDVLMKKFPDITKQLPIDDKIFLNKDVNRIVWDANTVNSGGVTVDCSDGSSYNADHVLVTVSLGVLQNLMKNFVPELPSFKQKAIESMKIGTVNKILLKFPEKWWPNDLKGFSLTWTKDDGKNLRDEFPEGPSKNGRSWLEDIYGFYVIDSHPRILLGWVVGEMAEEVELISDDVAIRGCMLLLNKFTGHKYNIPQPDGVLRSKWKTNTHFNGSYSYISRESEENGVNNEDLASPLINNGSKQVLLFAGEATHSSHFSTVHGAIETGYREADRILNIYRATNSFHTKIAIIGAGISGLGAATTLQDMGIKSFTVFEAQDRIGGRIHSIELDDGQILELGAQWIHGTDNPLYKLAAKHELLSEIKSEEGLGWYVRDNGDVIDRDVVKAVDFQIGLFLTKCEGFVEAVEYPASVGDFLRDEFHKYLNTCHDLEDVRAIKLELFDWHVRFQIIDNSCSNLNKLSAKGWGRYVCINDEAHINLQCGYQRLVQILADSLPNNSLRLSTAIADVKYEQANNLIYLITQSGSIITCEHLIITSSLGILKNNRKIQSLLPKLHSESIERLGFDSIGKIFLVFDHKWWNFEGIQFIWRKDTILGDEDKWTMTIQGFDSVLNAPRVLLGWVGGQGVQVMEGLSEEQVGIHCVATLRRFLPNHNVPSPIKIIRTRWSLNPWIQGGYSHITPDCDELDVGMHQLSQPVFIDGKLRILIAGEAANSMHYSTAHGAYESGQQQAEYLASHIL